MFVIIPLALVAAVGLIVGALLLVDSMYQLRLDDPYPPQLAYQSGHVLVAGMSAAVTLTLFALLRHVDFDGQARLGGRG
ncbi:hypothetical protein [Streptomyces sp. S3(2020)]|uniref:hypothetical protein n=1 Tax=Streptomyces sp. S3(2020) TaxID=2732044 RepID=UPI001F0D20E3|nr:hypothetical protein [Streptomyces sp. S3(2020)]